MSKVSPDYLPPEERPSEYPLHNETILKLSKLNVEYEEALLSGDESKVYKAQEKVHNFLVETQLLTPDKFSSLDPESQLAVIEADKLTQNFYGKAA